jgi:hypothetical protein
LQIEVKMHAQWFDDNAVRTGGVADRRNTGGGRRRRSTIAAVIGSFDNRSIDFDESAKKGEF